VFSKSCHCDHSRFLCVVSGRPGIRGNQLACQLVARLKSDIECQQNVPLQSLKLRWMSFVMHRKKKKCLYEVVGTSTKSTKQYLIGIQFVACTWKAMQVVDVRRYLWCSIVVNEYLGLISGATSFSQKHNKAIAFREMLHSHKKSLISGMHF